MREAWALAGIFIAGIGIGLIGSTVLPVKLNEPSTFEVHPAERCVPTEGWTLKFDYNGKGTTYIQVLPPTEAPKASKEKK